MSALAPSVGAMKIHPWRGLRLRERITLAWHDGGPMGWSRHSTQTVSLRSDLTYAERRCTLEHELIHLERGPVPVGWVAQDEERVRRETARRMLPCIREIGEALAWAACEDEAADELAVDRYVLRYRLRHLHPAERGYLHNRLAEVD